MKKKYVIFTVFLAILFIGISLYPMSSTKMKNQQLIGQPAPDIVLNNDEGDLVEMHKYIIGQPAIVFFWATWCPHCRTQLKELSHSRKKIEQKGIKLVLINVGEAREKVLRYKQQQGIDLMILLDQASKAAGSYHVVGLPTFYFINRNGKIVDVKHSLGFDYEKVLNGE